jgi:hypothetical protein
MTRIDYSKWDNLDEYSDDDSDDDNDGDVGNGDDGRSSSSSMTPRVTRLDGPSKVTFGGSSASSTTTTPLINIEPTSSSLSSSCRSSSDDNISTATTKLSLTPNNDENILRSSWTERGGLVESESTTIIDGNPQKRKLYWSQDRYSVTLRLELLLHGHNNNNGEEEEKQEKIQSVDVNGILPFSDRFCATGSTRPVLQCQGSITNANNNNKVIGINNSKNNSIGPNNLVLLLEGELPHPVYIAEDDDDVDWSVVKDNSSRRFLMITLYKAVPMQGLFVWWRRHMMKFPELDLQQVKDDPATTPAASSSAAGSTTAPAASQDFLKSWEEAHKIFREEKLKKKKIIV